MVRTGEKTMPKAMRRSQHGYCAFPVRSTSIAVPPIREGLQLGYRRVSALREGNASAAKHLQEIAYVRHVL